MRSVLVRLSRRGLYSEPLWGVYGKTPALPGDAYLSNFRTVRVIKVELLQNHGRVLTRAAKAALFMLE